MKLKARDFIAFFLGVFSALFFAAYLQEKSKTVAVVNGQAVSRSLFANRLVHVCGDDVMNMLVDETLVLQEMKRQGVSVSAQDLNTKMNLLRANFSDGKKFKEWQEKHFLSAQDITAQIKSDTGLEKLVEKSLDENEMRKYYENAKNNYKTAEGKRMTYGEAKPQIIAVFVQVKKKNVLENLRASAVIQKFPLLAPLAQNP